MFVGISAGIIGVAGLLALALSSPFGPATSLSQADASFFGEGTGDQSGSSLAIVGDVNGDGFDDLLIGAPHNDTTGASASEDNVALPGAGPLARFIRLARADASFTGERAGDQSGWSVAPAGDVNGDGRADFLIGAYLSDRRAPDAGQTYLILGRTGGWGMGVSLTRASASFLGQNIGDQSGWSVASAGDVNRDGLDDLLIGAHFNDGSALDAGKTYLVMGKTTGWGRDTLLFFADASFQGEAGSDRSGNAVASAGDVNGDGFADILIGAALSDEFGTDAGQTYLILGKATGWARNTALSTADASFIGEEQGDLSGVVRGLGGGCKRRRFRRHPHWGDLERRGVDQYWTDLSYSGKASGWTMDVRLSQADASFIGEVEFDESGCPLASAGDVNSDGFDDILNWSSSQR